MHITTLAELDATSHSIKFTIDPEIIEQARAAATLRHMKLATNGLGDYKLLTLPGKPPKPVRIPKPKPEPKEVRPPGRPRSGKWLPLDAIEVGQTISVTLSTTTRNPLQYVRNMASAHGQRTGWALSVSRSTDGASANITRNA